MGEKKLVLVIDEFSYLVKKNRALLSELQHLIDHKLTSSKFMTGFTEAVINEAKSDDSILLVDLTELMKF